jgi:hypothetical protein
VLPSGYALGTAFTVSASLAQIGEFSFILRRWWCCSAPPATSARRKLLPGLYHLASAGFIPGCRIVGVSLDAIDADGFRRIARGSARRVLQPQDQRRRLGDLCAAPGLRAAGRRRAALREPWSAPKPASAASAGACTT